MMKKVSKKLESTSNSVEGDSGMKLFKDVSAKLRHIYKQKIFPLERQHRFHDLQYSPLEDGEFDAKPTVLLLGQYSTGKICRKIIFISHQRLIIGHPTYLQIRKRTVAHTRTHTHTHTRALM